MLNAVEVSKTVLFCDRLKMLDLEDSDNDVCDEEELKALFAGKCELRVEHEVASKDTFVLHVTGTVEANCNVAIGASNDLCEVYNFSNNQLAKIDTLGGHFEGVIGVRFCPENRNLLYSASTGGYINLWDIRTSAKLVAEFKDTTAVDRKDNKPLTCFDISPNNRLLCAGTDQPAGGEPFLLFWDIRNVKLMGGYWESHTDVITQVQFHPDNSNLLISGSTDGLINVFDLNQSTETKALSNSLNTESSIEQLLWCRFKKKECISAITHTADFQLWRTDDVEPFAHFRRDSIGTSIKRKSSAHCYIVTAHSYDYDKMFLLAASNWNNGECLRAVAVTNKSLMPLFMVEKNTQRVRCSWYNEHHKMLVTGGESGYLNFWNVDFDT